MNTYIVVTPFFPSPNNWRGAFVYDQVKAIERTGLYKIMVFRPCTLRWKKKSYFYNGIEVNYVPSFFTPSYLFNGLGGSLNGENLLREIQKKGVSLGDIAVIHVHTAAFACYATALKKKSPKIKTVIQYHDPDPYQIRLGKLALWKPNATYRAKKLISQFKYLDLHLCISEKVKYNLIHFPTPHPHECYESYIRILKVVKQLRVMPISNTYVLYNGVDTSRFVPIMGQKNPNIFKIGCIANFVDWKDQMTLIKAVEILVNNGKCCNIRVSFVGSGVTKNKCMDYITEHELHEYFIFEKEVDHPQLTNYYNTLDLFVLPSYFEGFGCVFTEAAACGVPFMGCKDQGAAEYIPDEEQDKWLINPGDYVKLAKNIDAYKRFGYRQRLNKSYDIDTLIKNFLDYLNKL